LQHTQLLLLLPAVQLLLQVPALYSSSYSQAFPSTTSAAAAAAAVAPPKRKKGAYLFEVASEETDMNKPQTFQTEQAMLARYNQLLKESGLMNKLR
jgi:hypothetical protein